MQRETVEFQGRAYYRYPDSKRRECRVYFRTMGFGGRPRYLHRDVYEAAHGPIPAGHVVHHVDHDPLNNDPSNLAAVPMDEHSGEHTREFLSVPENLERMRQHMDRARESASEWHRSDAGRAWHSEASRAAWEARRPLPHACQQCGAGYESKLTGRGTRFCSNNCKSAWRRASGKDDVERICASCGCAFTTNRYSRTRTCSRSCGRHLAHRPNGDEGGGLQHHG